MDDLDGGRRDVGTGTEDRTDTGFAQGTPRDHYTLREAEQAIADAAAVIEFCARSIPR